MRIHIFIRICRGLVVSVKHGELVYRRALGYSDFSAGTPMELTDVFHCASVAKLFTATAVMQLAERDRLDIDSRVSDIISGFKINDKRADSITVKDLLQHTSGIGMPYDLHWERPETSETALKEYVLSDRIRKKLCCQHHQKTDSATVIQAMIYLELS